MGRHHHNQDIKLPSAHKAPHTAPLSPSPPSTTTNLPAMRIILPLWECQRSAVMQYGSNMPFEMSFSHSTECPWKRHPSCVSIVPAFLLLHSLVCMCHSLFRNFGCSQFLNIINKAEKHKIWGEHPFACLWDKCKNSCAQLYGRWMVSCIRAWSKQTDINQAESGRIVRWRSVCSLRPACLSFTTNLTTYYSWEHHW